MPWAVPEEEKQPRVLDLISALSDNCFFPICLKVKHGCENEIKNTALCVKGLAALKLWFFGGAVNGLDDSSCGFSLTICVVILGCYLVCIPNTNQARESPTLPETSPPLRLELTKRGRYATPLPNTHKLNVRSLSFQNRSQLRKTPNIEL